MQIKNYYNVLFVQADASSDEIKKAYRKLSKKYHPDNNNGDDFFTEAFKNINEANEILSDPKKRREYDFKLRNLSRVSTTSNSTTNTATNKSTENEAVIKSKTKFAPIVFTIFFIVFSIILWFTFKINTNNNSSVIDVKDKAVKQSDNRWVTVEMSDIYKEPSLESEVVGHIPKNQSYEAVEDFKYFIKIFYTLGGKDETGYLRKKNLEKLNNSFQ